MFLVLLATLAVLLFSGPTRLKPKDHRLNARKSTNQLYVIDYLV